MTIKERIKSDIKTYKALDKDKRREFVWDYYKIPIISVICIAALVLITVIMNIGRADTVMYAVLVNADDSVESSVFDDILRESGTDMTGKTVDVAASYTLYYDDSANSYADTVQVLAALFGIGDLDVFAADEPVFKSYTDQEAFIDLSLFIERDVLDKHELYTYVSEEGREVVAGIWLKPGSPLHDAGYYTGDVIIGVAANAQNLDPAIEFIKELVKIY